MKRYLITTRPILKKDEQTDGKCFGILNVPVTELSPNRGFNPVAEREFSADYSIFTSSYGVELFFGHFSSSMGKSTVPVAIGNRTAQSIRNRGFTPVVPDEKTSTGVVKFLEKHLERGNRVSLFVSSKSNGIIQSYLEKNGISHMISVLYSAEILHENSFLERALDSHTFGVIITSSFEARAIFKGLLNKEQIKELTETKKIFSIGKTTTEELKKLGIKVDLPQGESDLEKLIMAIEKEYCNQ